MTCFRRTNNAPLTVHKYISPGRFLQAQERHFSTHRERKLFGSKHLKNFSALDFSAKKRARRQSKIDHFHAGRGNVIQHTAARARFASAVAGRTWLNRWP
jgi:hypothetical protein